MLLTESEFERYSRHLVIPEVGEVGQQKLKSASVLIIGAGGLGSPLSLYLAAAGIGNIGIVDFDTVSLTNLQRQVIYDTADLGKPKAELAGKKILAINPGIKVKIYNTKLTSENAVEILRDYDIIADGTDNFSTRYLVNDACLILNKPNVYASILRFNGQVSLFNYNNGPCYRCVYPEPPAPGEIPSCEEGGVIGVLPGIIGTLQANEIIKIILGAGKTLSGRLLLFEGLTTSFRELKIHKDKNCPSCSKQLTTLSDYDMLCGTNGNVLSNMSENKKEITVEELKKKIENNEKFILVDVREPYETHISTIGGVLIPMKQLPYRIDELNKDDEIIVYCRTGNRSYYATEFLTDKQGFKNVKNLIGGINAWAEKIDNSLTKY
ncbi:MAG: molybdopterin-synthase adenylyltransferase MoeB [Ignavibacteriae bacterium]|nr:MAG: molybdopterin-synthase adenylyltransferase MoeB [Ignavibacteriota bacterium]